jgi:hypothetical protein
MWPPVDSKIWRDTAKREDHQSVAVSQHDLRANNAQVTVILPEFRVGETARAASDGEGLHPIVCAEVIETRVPREEIVDADPQCRHTDRPRRSHSRDDEAKLTLRPLGVDRGATDRNANHDGDGPQALHDGRVPEQVRGG